MIYSGKDLADAFRTVRKNTLLVAHDIPADKYGYRATPDTRTVGETLAHVCANTQWVHRVHAVDKKTFITREDFGRYIGDANAYAATLTTRDQIVKALEHDGEAFATWLGSLSDATLAEIVGFPPPLDPPKKTRFEMLLGVKEHEMHHRAQLMLVERLLGIVPHLTRQRLAR
jgi:uncharacterized damage-inducible protein DinB